MAGARVEQRTTLVLRRTPCTLFRQSALHQHAGAGVNPLRLPPQHAAQLPPDPPIKCLQCTLAAGELEVRRPAAQQTIEKLDGAAHASAASPRSSARTFCVTRSQLGPAIRSCGCLSHVML